MVCMAIFSELWNGVSMSCIDNVFSEALPLTLEFLVPLGAGSFVYLFLVLRAS